MKPLLAMILSLFAEPSGQDLDRFPQRQAVLVISDAEIYRQWLYDELAAEREDPWFWEELIADSGDALEAWQALREGRPHKLKELIGPVRYSLGMMPDVWAPSKRLYAPWRR